MSVKLLASLLLAFAISSSAGSYLVETRNLDPIAYQDNWRRIGVRITNESNVQLDISKDSISYYITDTAKSFGANIWYFVNRSKDWQIFATSPTSARVSVVPVVTSNGNAGNYRIVVSFNEQHLRPQGVVEVQLGVHRDSWTMINQSGDPSYVASQAYVKNNQVAAVHNAYRDNKAVVDAALAAKGVPVSTVAWVGSAGRRFLRQNLTVSEYKFRSADSSVSIAIANNGRVVSVDSLANVEVALKRQTQGGLDDELQSISTQMGSNSMVRVTVFAPNVSGGSSAARVFAENRGGTCTDVGLCEFAATKSDLEAIRNSQDFPLVVWAKGVQIVPDMWNAAYRMNVDNFHAFGAKGQGINACVWEQPLPSFNEQMAVDVQRISQADLGVCYRRNALTQDQCASSGYSWSAGSSVCVNELYMSKTECSAAGAVWKDQSSDARDQHVAYMLASVKNNRTNTTAPVGAPSTFGGTGFSPEATLMHANFAQPVTGEGYIMHQYNALKWAIDNGADVVSQSWHTTAVLAVPPGVPLPTEGTTSLNAADNTGEISYMDRVIDYLAQTPPYPTIIQAAGNYGGNIDWVVHKGLNTIVVGQDNRDGYDMISFSSWKNPTTGVEYPHVTAGVNATSDGVTPFENADGTRLSTMSGGTSMAAAMANGFTADLISVDPSQLKGKPWLIRSILMASADNVESVWWEGRGSVDKKGGAGRLNGINAYYIAKSPYNASSPAGFGFASGAIGIGTKANLTYSITPSTTGLLRVGLSWFGNVSAKDLTVSLSDLDLYLLDKNGAVVASSASLIDPVEMIHANVVAGEAYTIKVSSSAAASYLTNFGIAWCNR